MTANAIVYTSNTGHTAAYAKLLGESTCLPVYSAQQAKTALAPDTCVIYLGWLMAGQIVGLAAARKRYRLAAVIGVGLGDSGAQTNSVRKACRLSENTPLFTLQGGMDHQKLTGTYKSMIQVLIKVMSLKKKRSEDEEKMLQLLIQGGNYVKCEELAPVLDWYRHCV